MKANILSADKKVMPVYSEEQQADVDTIMVEVKVQFVKENGDVYFTQTYARRPEDFDEENPTAYFDDQAQALQNDLDQQVANVDNNTSNATADVVIQKLLAHKK